MVVVGIRVAKSGEKSDFSETEGAEERLGKKGTEEVGVGGKRREAERVQGKGNVGV